MRNTTGIDYRDERTVRKVTALPNGRRACPGTCPSTSPTACARGLRGSGGGTRSPRARGCPSPPPGATSSAAPVRGDDARDFLPFAGGDARPRRVRTLAPCPAPPPYPPAPTLLHAAPSATARTPRCRRPDS